MAYLNWGLAAFTVLIMAVSEFVARWYRLGFLFFAVEAQLWFPFNRIIRRPLNPTSSGNITNFIKFTGLNIAFTGMFIFKIAASLLMRRSSVEDSYGVLLAVALVSIHKFHLQVCKSQIVGPRICVKANIEPFFGIFQLSVASRLY